MYIDTTPPENEYTQDVLLPPSWLWVTSQSNVDVLSGYDPSNFILGDIFTMEVPGFAGTQSDLDVLDAELKEMTFQEVIYIDDEGNEYIGYVTLDSNGNIIPAEYGYFGSKYGYQSEIFSKQYQDDHSTVELVDVYDENGKGQLVFEFSEDMRMLVEQDDYWQNWYMDYSDYLYLEDGYILLHPAFDYNLIIESSTSNTETIFIDDASSLNQPTQFIYELDHSIYDAPVTVEVTQEITDPFDDVVSSFEPGYIDAYPIAIDTWLTDLTTNEGYDITYSSTDSFTIDLNREDSYDIEMSAQGEQQTITMPAYYDDGHVVNEHMTFTNLTSGSTTYPEPVSEVLEIEINTPSPSLNIDITDATVNFSNGNPPINVDLELVQTSPTTYEVIVNGNYYYDHTTQQVVDESGHNPENGHHYETFVNEIPTPLDEENVVSSIDFTVTSSTYTEVDYNMSINVESEEKIRNSEDAQFNITLTEDAEFDTSGMTHLANINSMKHISRIADEYQNQLDK